MRIAIISKSDRFGGGASKVAEDLTTLLNDKGHYAHHYRRNLSKGYTNTSTSIYGRWENIAKKIYYKLKYLGFQEIIPFELLHLTKEIKKHKYDLIHFHDLTTSISPFTLMYLSSKLPVVWTMHDYSPFTGGCIYPNDCIKFKSTCKNCPQKGYWPMDGKFDLAFFYLKIKSILHKRDIHLISPSKWLANISSNNTIIKKSPTIIKNGVNITIYKFLDKFDSKNKLKIPKNRLTILLTSHSIQDPRKGFSFAIKVLKSVKHLNPFIILVGNINNETKNILSEFDFFSSGYISEYQKLNILYNAADLFLNCSLEDNFPLVVLETMASGTPTFGFDTGGIPEMIQQNINGYLVENKDTKLLAEKIEEIHFNKHLPIFSQNAREIAENKFSHKIFLENHLKFYKSIINIT